MGLVSAPENYGLDPAATLAHEADADRPDGFEAYWQGIREAAAAMPDRFQGTLDAPVNEIIFRSLMDVRIVGRLHLPPRRPHGLVITAEAGPPAAGADEAPDWAERGLAMLHLVVRGVEPSTLDLAPLGEEWILHCIESAQSWVLRGATVDVITAHRAMRRHFGAGFPIALHGESLGAGLAVIAAAQLTRLGDPPVRLVIALPSLGDWRWRTGRYCNGAGRLVNMVLEARRQDAAPLLEQIRLFDAALHARDVTSPALCKLALRDDTVPAPSAAAVFNALASRPRYRFLTPYGHYEGGIANARRHAEFRLLAARFLDPALGPDESLGEAVDDLERQTLLL